MTKNFYIEIMGCQMNKLDGELIIGQLSDLGYSFTPDINQASVIIFVTCSVRQHAEDKVITKIDQLKKRRRSQPDLILAVVGCMAERLGSQLLEKYPQIDFVCSPGQIHQLGALLEQAACAKQRTVLLNDPDLVEPLEALDASRRRIHSETPFMAYVRAMRGCNNFCRYCVVPYVRGPEQSRPPQNIIEECRRLIDNGVIEITLLGQTINSYSASQNGKTWDLADLLEKIHELPGLRRLRFVTSYPRNFSIRILHALADLPRVCEYLHIPAQSGSDRILRAMNRRYTAARYLDLIAQARALVPHITVSGDFIVGFPGEQDADFEATQNLLRQVRYKNCFIFKYSPRPGTHADKNMKDDVPEAVKKQRNTDLLDLQNQISLYDNQQYLGQTMSVLVEGPSKHPQLNRPRAENRSDQTLQLVGRSPGDHIVVFYGEPHFIGRILPVKILSASALTFFAEICPPSLP